MTDENTIFTVSDTHAHVVFDVDDGAMNLEMSLELLRMAYREGIRDMICASHSWGDLDRYHENLEVLKKAAREQKIDVNLYPGCEVHCRKQDLSDLIHELSIGFFPTANGTDYVLIEFSPNAYPEDILLYARMLKEKTGKKIVVAHIERCRHLEKRMDVVEQLQAMGCLLQLNAYSLVRESRPETKAFARQLIAEKRITFLGSDCHRTNHRPPKVQAGLRYIHETCDPAYARAICTENAQKLLFYRI